MSRLCALALISTLAIHTGCQSPQNGFNPYVGYGSPRIPSPGTGSYRVQEPYYQQQSAPGGQQVGQANFESTARVSSEATVSSDVATGGGWRPPRHAIGTGIGAQPSGLRSQSPVIPANFQQREPTRNSNGVPATNDSSLLQRILQDRLHVNEATSAPASFLPTQPVRSISSISPNGTLTPTSPQSNATSGWRAKYSSRSSDGVVVR